MYRSREREGLAFMNVCETNSTDVGEGRGYHVRRGGFLVSCFEMYLFVQDAAGVVKRWEITRGTVINDYGVVSYTALCMPLIATHPFSCRSECQLMLKIHVWIFSFWSRSRHGQQTGVLNRSLLSTLIFENLAIAGTL